MKLESGLYTDCAEVDNPPGSYRFAKGMVDGNTPGSKENEAGFTNLGIIAPYNVIGVIALNIGFVVFSTNNSNSEIGVWDGSTYTTTYNDPNLNFNTSHPIKGEYRIEATGNRVITWIDDVNPPRILNIDNLSLVNTVNDLTIFQDVTNPSISAYSISDSGGSLPVGAYVPFTFYKGLDGSTTNIFVHDKTFYINDDSKSVAFNLDDGAPGLTVSNKAINITFAGCDTNFDTLVVGFVRIAGQIITAYEAIVKSISSTINVTITGAESLTSVSLDQVLTANSIYENAKAITQVNNQLVLANLTSKTLPNFQPYALAIKVDYSDSVVNIISNVGTHKDTLPPSLMPGDVYALYIGLELNKGGWVFYHIPGRPSVAGETNSVTTDGLTYLKYQVDNTTNSGGATNMGYWENTSETYPNDPIYDGTIAGGPNLRNQKVRHHRMPTVSKLESATYSSNLAVGTTSLVKLSLVVSNVNIPAGIQSQIKRWKLFFAKKSPNNSIVGGSDLLQYSFGNNADATVRWSTGGNWGNDAVGGSFDGFGITNRHTDTLLSHPLDHLYAPAEFTPDFAWFHYGLTSTGVDTPWNGFRGTGGLLSTTGASRGQTAGMVLDYTAMTSAKTYAGQFRRVQAYQYLPQNAKINFLKSAYTEPFFGVTITPLSAIGTVFNDVPYLHVRSSGTASWSVGGQFSKADGVTTPGNPETVYYQYGKVVSNAHVSFTSQDLIPFEGYYSPSTTGGTFNGGDTFFCYMGYLACAPLAGNQASVLGDPAHQGIRAWHSYVGYSRRNWNYRHQTSGDISTYYYGKTDVTTLYSPQLSNPVDVATTSTTGTLISSAETLNNITYNPDFNSLNNLMVGTTYSVNLVNATQFPNLIIYSTVQGTESKDISWRIFPSGNRYTMPKNKGAIINIQGISNRDLLIHCHDTLYKTKTDVTLNSVDGEDVNLRSNELFSIQPEELVSATTSYAGTQNKFSCILTKVGYVSVDDAQGKVFLLTDSLNEISTNGLRQFFRDNMGVASDNPFNSNGYTVAYDEKYNRLLLTKKQGGTSFTVSYNPIKKTWVSYHDYVPDFMFNTLNNKTYSFKSNSLYQHGTGNYNTFYGGVIYPSIIDIVHNPEPTLDKVFISTNWLSESYNSSNQLQYFDTIGYVTIRSLDHCTPRAVLSTFTNFDDLYTNNTRNLNRTWYYNEIRDVALQPGFTQGFYQNYELDLTKLNTNMEWFDQRKFTDKFVICRLEYPNLNNNRFLLMETDIKYEHATK